MSIESAVYTRLAAHSGVSTLVGIRIYPMYLPQTPTYPCIAYRRQDGSPLSLLASDTDIIETRFDITSFSTTFDEAINVSDEIRQCWQRFSGTVDSMVILDTMIVDISPNYEPDFELHESSVVIKITHRV